MPTLSRARSADSKKQAPQIQAISDRAYEIYVSRGGEHGHDLEDWLRAESEMLAASVKKPAAKRASRAKSAAS